MNEQNGQNGHVGWKNLIALLGVFAGIIILIVSTTFAVSQKNVDDLKQRVNTLAETASENIKDLATVSQKTEGVEEDIKEIKADVKEIKTAILQWTNKK